MTAAESILWERLRAGKLRHIHFRRQQIIDGYIADFYCHAAGLVVEVDGPSHSASVEYDEQRDRAMTERGLLVIRVTNEEVFGDPAVVVRRILMAARERVPTAPTP